MNEMETRRERVRLETVRHRMTGMLALARDGYRSRVSDLLNASERDFLVLTDAVVEPLSGDGQVERHAFVAVSRSHIVYAVSEADDPA